MLLSNRTCTNALSWGTSDIKAILQSNPGKNRSKIFRSQAWVQWITASDQGFDLESPLTGQEQNRAEQSYCSHLQVFHRPWSSSEFLVNFIDILCLGKKPQQSGSWGWAAVGSSSPREPCAVCSCPWPRVGAPSISGVSSSEHLWGNGSKIKHGSNPKLCQLPCKIRAWFKIRLFLLLSVPLWFIWVYFFVLKFIKRKSTYQKGNRFQNVSFEACNLPQKPIWNLQCGLPHRERVKTWFGAAWQWLSAPNSSNKTKILLPKNSACIQLEWKCNRKLDGLKSICFSFSLVA